VSVISGSPQTDPISLVHDRGDIVQAIGEEVNSSLDRVGRTRKDKANGRSKRSIQPVLVVLSLRKRTPCPDKPSRTLYAAPDTRATKTVPSGLKVSFGLRATRLAKYRMKPKIAVVTVAII
jgi:hypothetical protein